MESFFDLLDDIQLFSSSGEALRKAFLGRLYCYCSASQLDGVDMAGMEGFDAILKAGSHTPSQYDEDSEVAKLLLTSLIIKCEELPGRDYDIVSAFLDRKAADGSVSLQEASPRSALLGLLSEVVLTLVNCYLVGDGAAGGQTGKGAGKKSARSDGSAHTAAPKSLIDTLDLIALTDFASGQSLGLSDCGMPKPFTIITLQANNEEDEVYSSDAQLRAVEGQRNEACIKGAYDIGYVHGIMSLVRALLVCTATLYGTTPLPSQLEGDATGTFQRLSIEAPRGSDYAATEKAATRGPKTEINWALVQGLMGELDTLRRHFIKFLLVGLRCSSGSDATGGDDGSALLALLAHVFVTDLDAERSVGWCLVLQRCRMELFADIAASLVGDLCHILGPAASGVAVPFVCAPSFIKGLDVASRYTLNAPVLHFGADYQRLLLSDGELGPHPLGVFCLDALRRATEAALDGLHAMSVSASVAQGSSNYPHLAVIKASALHRSTTSPNPVSPNNRWVRHFFLACLPLTTGVRALASMLWLAKEFPTAYLHTAAVRAVSIGRLSVTALTHVDKELQVQGSSALVRGVIDALHTGDIESQVLPSSDPLRPLLMLAPFTLAIAIHSIVYTGATWIHDTLPDSEVNRSVKRSLNQVLGVASDEAPQLIFGSHSRDSTDPDPRARAISQFLSCNLLGLAQGVSVVDTPSEGASFLDFVTVSLPKVAVGSWSMGDKAHAVIASTATNLRASYFRNLQDERHLRDVEQAKALRKASWAKTALGAMPLSAVAEAIVQSLITLNIAESTLFRPLPSVRPDVVDSMRSVESEALKRPISKELFAMLHREGHRQMQHIAALAAQEDELQRVSSSGAGDGGQRIPIGKMATMVRGGVHSVTHTKDRLTLLPPRAQLQCAAFGSILRSMASIGLMAAQNQTVTPESTIRASHALVGRVLVQMPAVARDQAIDSLCELLDQERMAVADDSNPIFPRSYMSVSNPFSVFSLCMSCLYMGAAQSGVSVYQRQLLTAATNLEDRGTTRVRPISSVDPEFPLGWVTSKAVDGFFEGDTTQQPSAYSHLAGRVLSVLLRTTSKDNRFLLRPVEEFVSYAPHISHYIWTLIHRDLCLNDDNSHHDPDPLVYSTVVTPWNCTSAPPPSIKCRVGMRLLEHVVNNRIPYTFQAFSTMLYFATGKKQSTRRAAMDTLHTILGKGRPDAPQIEALLLDHGTSQVAKLIATFSVFGDRPKHLPLELERSIGQYTSAFAALDATSSDDQSVFPNLQKATEERMQAVLQYHTTLFRADSHKDILDVVDDVHRRLDLLFLLSSVAPDRFAHIVLGKIFHVYAEAASVINSTPGDYVGTLRVDTPLVAIMRELLSSADVELLIRKAFGSLATKEVQASGRTWTIPDFAPQQRFLTTCMSVLRKYPRGAEDLVVRVMGILAAAVRTWLVDVKKLLDETEAQSTLAPVATSKKDLQTILTVLANHCEHLSQKRSAIYHLQAARGDDLLIATQVPGDIRMLLPILSFVHPQDLHTTYVPRLAKMMAIQHANSHLLAGKGEAFVGTYLSPEAVFSDMSHLAGSTRKIMTPVGDDGELSPMPRSLLSTSSVFNVSVEEVMWYVFKRQDLPRDVFVSPSKCTTMSSPPTPVSILLGLLRVNTIVCDSIRIESRGNKPKQTSEDVLKSVNFTKDDVAIFGAACAAAESPSDYLEHFISQLQLFTLGTLPSTPSATVFGRSSPHPALGFFSRWSQLEKTMSAMLQTLGSRDARNQAQTMLRRLSQLVVIGRGQQTAKSVGYDHLYGILREETRQRMEDVMAGKVGPSLSAHAHTLRTGVITGLASLRYLSDTTHHELPVPIVPRHCLDLITRPPTTTTLPIGVIRPNDAAIAEVSSLLNPTQHEMPEVLPSSAMLGSGEIQKTVHTHRSTIQCIQAHANPTEQQIQHEFYETLVLDSVLRGSLERHSNDAVLHQTLETLKSDHQVCEQRFRALPQ